MSTLEIEQQLLDVLARTPMRLMHAALPFAKERNNGVIINVSSAGWLHRRWLLQRLESLT
jgi:NADP-dependent 3-hydroxy acid dehydrogenase YdfG